MMILLICMPCTNLFAQVEPTQLLAISRTSGQRATSFEVKIESGNHLLEVDSLLFSNPEITAEVRTMDPKPFSTDRVAQYGSFTVTIPETVQAGRYEVRAKGRNGLSNPRAFLVTDFLNEVATSISHDPNSAASLKLNTFLNADATAANIDYYEVELQEASTLEVNIVAQRLDSRMIPACKVLDSEGHQIANCRGADGVDASWRSPQPLPAGRYRLAIHDFIYRGGSEYHYQVVASTGTPRSLESESQPTDGRLPYVWNPQSTSMASSAFPRSSNDATVNREPSVNGVALPYSGTHAFSQDQPLHIFEFEATKGQLIAIEVTADRWGSPSDGRVVIQRVEKQETGPEKLHDVNNLDDSQNLSDGAMNLVSKDPAGVFTAPESGRYRVSVRDLDMGHTLGNQKPFSLRIGAPEPSFDLLAYRPFSHSDLKQSQPTGSRLFRGGTEIIRLIAIRKDGWSGPIRVRVEDLPEGVSAPEVLIAPNQSLAQIALTAAEDAPRSLRPIRITAQSEDGSIQREAAPAVIQWGKGAGRDFIQSRRISSLWISVSDQDQLPLTTTFGDGNVIEVKKGDSAKAPIQLTRLDGGKAACVIRAKHLPAGVKVADLTIPAENNDGELEIKAEGNVIPGTYSLWLQVETKIKYQPNPESVTRAQAYRDQLQSLLDAPDQKENSEAIQAAISDADKALEAAKNASKEKEVTVFLPTNTATLRVIEP